MRNILIFLTIFVSTACGTQIGNPGVSRDNITPWFKNEKLLFAVNSQLFHNSVDAMTVSDYAYSKVPSRVMSSRTCDLGGGGNVREDVSAKHSVVDATASWLSSTELELKRTYKDVWSLGDGPLVCDQGLSFLQVDAFELFSRDLKLESELKDTSSRQLKMEARDGSRTIESRIDIERIGKRAVEFRAETMNQDALRIYGEVRGDVESTVRSVDELGRPLVAVLKEDRSSVLRFMADRDAEGHIIQRSIDDAVIDVNLSGLGTARITFARVTWAGAKGCMPQSGLYTVALTDFATQETTEFTIDFARSTELQMIGGGNETFLDPFACVLREG